MRPCGYPGDRASARQPGPLDFGPWTDFTVLPGLSAWLLQSYPERQQGNDASKGSGHPVPSASIYSSVLDGPWGIRGALLLLTGTVPATLDAHLPLENAHRGS